MYLELSHELRSQMQKKMVIIIPTDYLKCDIYLLRILEFEFLTL